MIWYHGVRASLIFSRAIINIQQVPIKHIDIDFKLTNPNKLTCKTFTQHFKNSQVQVGNVHDYLNKQDVDDEKVQYTCFWNYTLDLQDFS